jgi:hypothetical protein
MSSTLHVQRVVVFLYAGSHHLLHTLTDMRQKATSGLGLHVAMVPESYQWVPTSPCGPIPHRFVHDSPSLLGMVGALPLPSCRHHRIPGLRQSRARCPQLVPVLPRTIRRLALHVPGHGGGHLS